MVLYTSMGEVEVAVALSPLNSLLVVAKVELYWNHAPRTCNLANSALVKAKAKGRKA